MTAHTFTASTDARASEVNANTNLLLVQTIINRLNIAKIFDDSDVDDSEEISEGFVYLLVEDQIDDSYVDTGATTCYYDENGVVAFCDVLDLFEDASIDSNTWTTATSGSGSATVTETSGYLQCFASANNGGSQSATATAISDGASTVDFGGQDCEIVFSYYYDIDEPDTAAGARVSVQLSDGSNHVNLRTHSTDATTGTHYVRVVYNDSTETVDVYVDGEDTPTSNDLSVSALGASKYIRLYADANTGGSALGTNTATGRLLGVGYRLDGAGAANSVFETAAQTIDKRSGSGIIYVDFENSPSITPSAVLSFNASNFGTDDCYRKPGDGSVLGTSFQSRITVAMETSISVTEKNIPVLRKWGALYD